MTATPVTQKREKVPSYLLFARLSAVRIPEVIILHIKKHRIERCLLYMVERSNRKSNRIIKLYMKYKKCYNIFDVKEH